MSSYTMKLKEYIEQFSQTQSGLTTADKIEIGRTHLFDFDYPIYDTDYKKTFETNFIRYFYMREIGFETEGLFKFRLETWLNLNMPYFNRFYESQLLEYDPLSNVKMDTTKNKTNDGTSHNTTNGTSDSTANGSSDTTDTVNDFDRRLYTDTPDNRLNIVDDDTNEITYASEIEENNRNNSKTENVTGNSSQNITTTNTQDGTTTNTVSEADHQEGKTGTETYQEMLMKQRKSFINVDMMVFDEMQQLFMLVY